MLHKKYLKYCDDYIDYKELLWFMKLILKLKKKKDD